VSIDILDEDHSLALALRRLALDATLRAALGREARAWWSAHHTLGHMADDYRRVISQALARSAPAVRPQWPAHLLDDGSQRARTVAREFGVSIDVLEG
jgi:hypothetical protein